MLKNDPNGITAPHRDQIIPINGMLKNFNLDQYDNTYDQIIPINGMLKNKVLLVLDRSTDQIIPINGMLKNACCR